MPGGRLTLAIRHIRSLLETRAAGERTDRKLVERFATERDDTAFAALVQRHGPMVFGVCRRVLGDHHNAEDTFQATFLVLARKAAALDRRGSVAGWLFTVAYHIAIRAQAAIARRQGAEQQIVDIPQPEHHNAGPDLRTVLDAELTRLPDKYRVPLVLCYLEGKTNEEAAEQLGWPSGTIKGRLARARELLRRRLAQRGVMASAGLLSTALSEQGASAAVPVPLMESTVQLAALVTAGSEIAGRISPSVAALAAGGFKDLSGGRLKLALVVAVAALCMGAGVFAHHAWTQKSRPDTRDSLLALEEGADERLPAGAVAQFQHDSLVTSVAFSPNGRLLAVEGADWRIDIWEVGTKKRLTSLRVYDFAPAIKGDVRLDIKFGKCGLWRPPAPMSFTFSADSKTVFGRGGDIDAEKAQIFQWDAATGNELHKFDADGRFCLSPDSTTLAAVSGKTIRLWEASSGKERQVLDVPDAATAISLVLSADGKKLLVLDAFQTVQLWDLPTNKLAGKFQVNWPGPFPEPSPYPIFSPDGRHLVTGGSWDGTLHLLEVAFDDAQRTRPLKVSPGLLHSATFSADAKNLAVVCRDQTVALLDAGSGKVLQWLAVPVPKAGITASALSPDGTQLVTGCTDGRALLWPIRSGDQ